MWIEIDLDCRDNFWARINECIENVGNVTNERDAIFEEHILLEWKIKIFFF